MFNTLRGFVVATAIIFGTTAVSFAQDGLDHADEHAHSAWHLGIFSGLTTNFDAEHTDPTIGVDLFYRFADDFSAGVEVEDIFASHNEILLMALLGYHATEDLMIFTGAGALMIEDVDGTEFVTRLGAMYSFHAGPVSIAPTAAADLVDGHFLVLYGLTFGIGL